MQNPQYTSLQRKDIVWGLVRVICIFTCPPPKKKLREGWDDGSAAKACDMKESRLVFKHPKTHISAEWTGQSILNLETEAEDRESLERAV